MGLNLTYLPRQTPLDEDEKEGLIIDMITTRAELDEHEQKNIEEAIQWSLQRTFKAERILTETFTKEVHKKMYGNVWTWAGEFRKTNKNIGVDKWQIAIRLKQLIDDAALWIAEKSFAPDELAVRYKHKLVSVHCFANGNGRHSRLMADIIIENIFNLPVFTWGTSKLAEANDTRKTYISALKKADAGNYKPLIAFARS